MSGKFKVKGDFNLNINEAKDNSVIKVFDSTSSKQGSFFELYKS